MDKKELVKSVTAFCIEHGILDTKCSTKEIEERIEKQSHDVIFVENLINMIIVKTRKMKDIDTGKLIELLIKLERLRLELEYKKPERVTEKC